MINAYGERVMAWIVQIDGIAPIENADAICVYQVGGWNVVDKIGAYNVGDLAVYVSIDSWVPTEIASFLSKGKEPREYNGVKGERLRSVKLRGVVSQGLLLPLEPTCQHIESMLFAGLDVSYPLNIRKWEAPIPAQLAGQVRGNFPSSVPKTDEERLQNMKKELAEWIEDKTEWEVSVKLHGSSCTMYMDTEGGYHVCSRNLDLKPDENNTFWKVSTMYNVEQKLRDANLLGYAIQGELIGEGINKNWYNIKGHDFYVFNVYHEREARYLTPVERRDFVSNLGLKHVPIQHEKFVINHTIPELMLLAERKSVLYSKAEEEGFVYKSLDGKKSFKTVSNRFLLKGGEDE